MSKFSVLNLTEEKPQKGHVSTYVGCLQKDHLCKPRHEQDEMFDKPINHFEDEHIWPIVHPR
mgnify:CR=1 FL=1